MSSLVTRSRPAESRPARTTVWTRVRQLGITADALLGLPVAGALTLLAFLTTGGIDLPTNTWTEIALTIIGAALVAAVPLLGARGRAWGAVTLLLFGALAALTFASIGWSVQPANSWVEANRTLSYVASFMGAMALARLAPGRWRALIGGVTAYATVLCGYALLVKVFPATFDPTDAVARLRAPFGYWNAIGLVAAMGIPGCVWAGARPEGGRVLRTLSVPAIVLLVSVVVLSYSRGAAIAALLGLACVFALGSSRLRGVLVLALAAPGAAVVSAWALSTPGLTADGVPLQDRTTSGHELGILLLVVVAVLTALGFAAAVYADRVTLSDRARRRIVTALVTLLALVPVAAVGALAASSRGLGGEISHVWTTMTSANTVVDNSSGRLAQLGSSRPRYWGEAIKVGDHALLAGVGALGYATARTRYTSTPLVAVHAHGYVVETFADFGLVGLALTLALLVAWALAVRRTLRAWVPLSSAAATERGGLVVLLAVVVIYGFSSLIDWTWFIPGASVPALICAGWLAARGPLSERVGRASQPRRLTDSPAVGAAVLGTAAAALLAVWVIWQPLRSLDAQNAASLALLAGKPQAALADAHTAAASDPVSTDPLWELSAIYSALGNVDAAHGELVKATELQPSNPATWEQLGSFDLQHDRASEAVGALLTAHRLDLGSPVATRLLVRARAQVAHG